MLWDNELNTAAHYIHMRVSEDELKPRFPPVRPFCLPNNYGNNHNNNYNHGNFNNNHNHNSHNNRHKNQSPTFVAVPVGVSCVLWFVYIDSVQELVCVCVPLSFSSGVAVLEWSRMVEVEVGFADELGYGKSGTVVQGTWFATSSVICFAAEDVLWRQGKRVSPEVSSEAEAVWVVQRCAPRAWTARHWVVKLPVQSPAPFEPSDLSRVAYSIQCVRLKCGQVRQHFSVVSPPTPPSRPERTTQSKWCWITAENAAMDLYHVWDDAQQTHSLGYALINTYACSQWTRHLFQNVRALTQLEDSDTEDERPNPPTLAQPHGTLWKIQCHYHSEFRKWIPSETRAIRIH